MLTSTKEGPELFSRTWYAQNYPFNTISDAQPWSSYWLIWWNNNLESLYIYLLAFKSCTCFAEETWYIVSCDVIIWGKWLKQHLLFLFVSATVVWVWHASCSSRQYWQTVKTFTTVWCVPCGITLPGVQQTRGGQGKWWPLCSSWAWVMSLGGMSPTGRSPSVTFTHLGCYHFHASWLL